MRISDGSSDVCSSDLRLHGPARALRDRGAVAVSRAGFIFDRNEARIDEALERRAFPELDREPEPAPAAMRAAWNWLDTLYRSEEHTSELQSLMRISYAVFCLQKKNKTHYTTKNQQCRKNHSTSHCAMYKHT